MKNIILRSIALLVLLVSLAGCFQNRWTRYRNHHEYYGKRKHYAWHHRHRHGGW